MLRTTRSTSLDNLRVEELVQAVPQRNSAKALYEYYKLAYAETLYRWGLLYNRAEVIKYMCNPPECHRGVEFLTDCRDCLNSSKSCLCGTCKKFSLNCMVCHLSVRGSANCCMICGHGGHTNCLKEWFSNKSFCLTGCGCQCLAEMAGLFGSWTVAVVMRENLWYWVCELERIVIMMLSDCTYVIAPYLLMIISNKK